MILLTLAFSNSFSILTVAAAGFGGIVIGALYKTLALKKSKKKILRLEDEMLANHSRILKLEEANARLQTELQKLRNAASASEGQTKAS